MPMQAALRGIGITMMIHGMGLSLRLMMRVDVSELLEKERGRGNVEEGVEKAVDLMETDLEVGGDEDVVKTSPGSNSLELPVELSLEEVPTEAGNEQSHLDSLFLISYYALLRQ